MHREEHRYGGAWCSGCSFPAALWCQFVMICMLVDMELQKDTFLGRLNFCQFPAVDFYSD